MSDEEPWKGRDVAGRGTAVSSPNESAHPYAASPCTNQKESLSFTILMIVKDISGISLRGQVPTSSR